MDDDNHFAPMDLTKCWVFFQEMLYQAFTAAPAFISPFFFGLEKICCRLISWDILRHYPSALWSTISFATLRWIWADSTVRCCTPFILLLTSVVTSSLNTYNKVLLTVHFGLTHSKNWAGIFSCCFYWFYWVFFKENFNQAFLYLIVNPL